MHPFSNRWKHQKTVRFSDVFCRWRKGALGKNGLKQLFLILYVQGSGNFFFIFLHRETNNKTYIYIFESQYSQSNSEGCGISLI